MALLKEQYEDLDEKWWAGSMESYCYLGNVQDLLADASDFP